MFGAEVRVESLLPDGGLGRRGRRAARALRPATRIPTPPTTPTTWSFSPRPARATPTSAASSPPPTSPTRSASARPPSPSSRCAAHAEGLICLTGCRHGRDRLPGRRRPRRRRPRRPPPPARHLRPRPPLRGAAVLRLRAPPGGAPRPARRRRRQEGPRRSATGCATTPQAGRRRGADAAAAARPPLHRNIVAMQVILHLPDARYTGRPRRPPPPRPPPGPSPAPQPRRLRRRLPPRRPALAPLLPHLLPAPRRTSPRDLRPPHRAHHQRPLRPRDRPRPPPGLPRRRPRSSRSPAIRIQVPGARCLAARAELEELAAPLLELLGDVEGPMPASLCIMLHCNYHCSMWRRRVASVGGMNCSQKSGFRHICRCVLQRNISAVRRLGRTACRHCLRSAPSPLWTPPAPIAARCTVDLELGTYHFPQVEVPRGETAYSLLAKRCFRGIAPHVPAGAAPGRGASGEGAPHDPADGTSPIISWWCTTSCRWARAQGVACSGRGRLGIPSSVTRWISRPVEPIRHNLLFERFLNPNRREMPDIDVDFCSSRRDEVIEHIYQTFGERERRRRGQRQHDEPPLGGPDRGRGPGHTPPPRSTPSPSTCPATGMPRACGSTWPAPGRSCATPAAGFGPADGRPRRHGDARRPLLAPAGPGRAPGLLPLAPRHAPGGLRHRRPGPSPTTPRCSGRPRAWW